MFRILRDLEANKEFRLFSLIPQKRVRPLNITINNTILIELNKNLNPETDIDFENFQLFYGTDLWNWHFDIKPIVKRNKCFEEEIVTNCMSAPLRVSRL